MGFFHKTSSVESRHVSFSTAYMGSETLEETTPAFQDAVEWCEENIPAGEWSIDSIWEEITIAREVDAAAFKIRWC